MLHAVQVGHEIDKLILRHGLDPALVALQECSNGLLKHFFAEVSLFSLDKVKYELEGEDGLWDWIKGNLPNEFFRSTGAVQAIGAFSELMVWAQNEAQYMDAAKAEFAKVADEWLPAYSKAFSGTVVTHEELAREAKKRIPLPNVCEEFGIPYIDTFTMLRALEARFHWHVPQA